MSWNNAYERKKFNARIKREIAEYQAAGMTEEQIAEIVMFDEEQFRNDRRYRMHTQEFCESDFDDDGGDKGKRQDHSCFLYRRCGDYDFLCRRRTCAKRKRSLPEYHWQAV